MNIVTSTEIRTKTSEIVKTLMQGGSIDLIHRSKVIGELRPKKYKLKLFNAKRVKRLVEKMNLPFLSYEEREKRYRAHLESKYGKGIS